MSDTLPQLPERGAQTRQLAAAEQTSGGSTLMQDARKFAFVSVFLYIGEIIIPSWDKGVQTDREGGTKGMATHNLV